MHLLCCLDQSLQSSDPLQDPHQILLTLGTTPFDFLKNKHFIIIFIPFKMVLKYESTAKNLNSQITPSGISTCRKRTSGGPRALMYGTATVGGAWNTDVISWKHRLTTCDGDIVVIQGYIISNTIRTDWPSGYPGNRMICSRPSWFQLVLSCRNLDLSRLQVECPSLTSI